MEVQSEGGAPATHAGGGYPITFTVESPESLSRWLWLIKWLLLIPHMIVLSILGFVAYFTLLATWFAILITGKRPKGMFDFHLGILRWSANVNAYGSHLTDSYPGFSMDSDSAYPVQLHAEYKESASRLSTFFRYFLAIPHWIVLTILSIILVFVWFFHVIVVLITGKPNAGAFKFIAGFNRWQNRANGYYWLLTDDYPPFSMD